MFKTNLRTIAQVSAIATAINRGCQSIPASSQDLSPSSFTTLPRTDGDRPILLNGINPSHLDIALPELMRYRNLEQHKHLTRYCPKRARCSHSKNAAHTCGKRYILDGKKFLARLPQFAETIPIDRLPPAQAQVKMPELYARAQDR